MPSMDLSDLRYGLTPKNWPRFPVSIVAESEADGRSA